MNETTKLEPEDVGRVASNDGFDPIPCWVAKEIRETWNAAQGQGQIDSYRILQAMVDRLGYGRFDLIKKGF